MWRRSNPDRPGTARADHVPGLSLAVVKDGKVIYARGFGARRLKENAPATPDTLYGVGSCTKSFIALAIMQLAQQGKLNLKDPVKKHLPEFKLGKEENPITIARAPIKNVVLVPDVDD